MKKLTPVNGSVIDTSVIVKLRNENTTAIKLLENIDKKYVPIIVVGELLHGAYKSSKRDANIKGVKTTLSHFKILNVDNNVAQSYALIKTDLQTKGTPIPDNDIWIAAIAHANDLSVATFDDHFKTVSQIKVVPIP